MSIQRELEAGIRGQRNLPDYNVGFVHNFQDILNYELNGYLPGSSYLRRRTDKIVLQPLDQEPRHILKSNHVNPPRSYSCSPCRSSSLFEFFSLYSRDITYGSSKWSNKKSCACLTMSWENLIWRVKNKWTRENREKKKTH